MPCRRAVAEAKAVRIVRRRGVVRRGEGWVGVVRNSG